MNAANIFSKAISIIIGLMFLVIGLLFFFKYDPDAYDVEAVGTITDIEEHYETVGDDEQLTHTVYIDYSANGTEYKHAEYFQYNSSMKIGDEVSFCYMSSDPSRIAGSNKALTPYFGLGAAVIGAVMLVIVIVKIVKKAPM